jgi:lipopolysaccharide biosynthesis glycosyltransferase
MKLNIAYSCNDAYIEHTGISMISLFENNKDFEEIEVFFIAKDVSDKGLFTLKNIAKKYRRKITIVPFDSICYDLSLKDTGRHIETIYAKLFFTRIEGIDKIFYLDSDTVVVDSLKELWEIDLEDFQIAGVETFTVDVKKKLSLLPKDNFINDGVALLNLKKLRDDKVLPQFLEFLASHSGNPPLLSEGTINKVCKGKILSLHPRFNLLSGLIFYKQGRFLENENLSNYYDDSIIKEAIEKPTVIHYLSAFYNRPWDRNCTHPFRKEYLYYKSISPWIDTPLSDKSLPIRLRMIGFLFKAMPYPVFKWIRNLNKVLN